MQYIQPETYQALIHFIMTLCFAGPALIITLVFGLPMLTDFLDHVIDSRTRR